MAKVFSFTVPTPNVGQVAPVTARMYSSTSLTGTRSLLDSTLLADIGYTGDPPEDLTWEISSADGTEYYWLAFVSANGVEGQLAYLGPEVTNGNVVIEVWTESAIGAVVSGIKFQATSVRKGAGVAGVKTIVTKGTTTTDANGYASLTLYADSGEYIVELAGYSSLRFDTTGRSGETVNYASEL